MTHWTVDGMLEVAVGIPSTDRRERLAHRLYQSLPCPGSDPAQELLDLGERPFYTAFTIMIVPTFGSRSARRNYERPWR